MQGEPDCLGAGAWGGGLCFVALQRAHRAGKKMVRKGE